MKAKAIFIFFLLLTAQRLAARPQNGDQTEPYLWPTDASTHLTSTFCEFRPRHYHAAIDIKTWNKTGYRIFAIDDGYVYRVRVGATGYGKAIYLKLRDGHIVVYAHLSGFNTALTHLTDSLRLAAHQNRLDWFPPAGQFQVHRGDLLGYTGDTGIGVPHLHFEIRDAQNRPINPLQFYRRSIQDHIPPAMVQLAVIPVGVRSTVQFKPDTLLLPLPAGHSTELEQPIYLTGQAYLAAKTLDRADGVANRLDFYRARLWANDSLLYQVRYDRFSYQSTRFIEVDKNFSLWRRGLGIFHNFFRHPANRLAFYGQTSQGGGLLNAHCLRPGKNRIRLEVADYFGNRTTLRFTLIYLPYRQLHLYTASRLSRDLLLGVVSREPVKTFRATWLVVNPHQQTVPGSVHFLSRNVIQHQVYTTMTVPLPPSDKVWWLQLEAEDNRGIPFLPVLVGEWSRPAQVERFRFRGTVLGLWGRGNVNLAGTHWPLLHLGPDRWFLAAPAAQALTDSTLLSLLPDSLRRQLAAWHLVSPTSNLTLTSPDSLLSIAFSPGVLYDSLYSTIQIKRHHTPLPPKAIARSPVYQVLPFDQPLNQGAWLQLHLPDSLRSLQGLGLYYLDRKKGWLFLPHAPDQWRARITSLEQFTLLQDTIPPKLAALRTRLTSKSAATGLRFHVEDTCAGIYREDQITVKINGQWTPFDYDPEENELVVPARFVPHGRSRVALVVTDNVGNTARLAVSAYRF